MPSILTRLFEREKKIDSAFGVIEYHRSFAGRGFWRGRVNFSPLNREIDVYIVGGRSGVAQSQRSVFDELTAQYFELFEPVSRVLYATLQSYWGDLFHDIQPEEIWQEFELKRVTIPNVESGSEYLELSYLYKTHDENYTVYLDRLRPLYGELDD